MNHRIHRHGNGPEHIDCICGRELQIDNPRARWGPGVYCQCERFWRTHKQPPIKIDPQPTDANQWRYSPYAD